MFIKFSDNNITSDRYYKFIVDLDMVCKLMMRGIILCSENNTEPHTKLTEYNRAVNGTTIISSM